MMIDIINLLSSPLPLLIILAIMLMVWVER